MSLDDRIAALAAAQHCVFSRAQAWERGGTRGLIQRRLDTGRWERLFPGVYRLAGCPQTWRQSLLALCFAWGPGSVGSHRSAGPLWRLCGFPAGVLELCVPRGRVRDLPGIVHRPRFLPPVDVTTVDAIPVTTPARTLIDLAGVVAPNLVEEALDDALRRRLVSLPRMRWRLRETGRTGRPGAALMRALLDARRDATSVPQSVFETRLLRALKGAGLPEPEVQHRIRDGGRVAATVDLAFPAQRLAVEAEGYRWHTGRLRFERDLARRNALTALGWRVVHVTWADLTDRADATIEAIVHTLRDDPRRNR